MTSKRNRPSKSTDALVANRGKKTKPQRTRKQKIARFFTALAISFLSLALIGTAGVIIAYEMIKLPDPNKDFQSQTTFIYYDDSETKMANLAIQNRTVVDYSKIPDNVKNAVVAAENRTFWTDSGISPLGMVRAGLSIARGKDMQGGSTITQQYIKVLYLNSERTVTRKFKELLLAVKMNKQYSKEKILGGYLNTIYYGRGAYGIEAAAKAYFDVSAESLDLGQAAVLASVINAPSYFDPANEKGAERLLKRYQYVLDGMLEMGTISQAEHDKYYKALPKFPQIKKSQRYGGPNGFIIKKVEQELADLGFNESEIYGGGLQVTTTINKKIQDATNEKATEYLNTVTSKAKPAKTPDDLHIGVATVDTNNGAVLAMYGGPDYIKNSRNWATTPRMAASTFKAYALVAGLRGGFTLNSTFKGNPFTPPGDTTPVRNESGHQYGTVNLKKATASSINTAFVDMTLQLENGPEEIIKAANDSGVPTGPGWEANGRISLGAAEVSPLDNATGYATFANGGYQVKQHFVSKVTDGNGRVLYEYKNQKTRTIDPEIASEVNVALNAVVTKGTGRSVARLGHDIGAKTGTAGVGTEIQSAWFVAYTRNISTAVMFVAGESGTENLDPYRRPGDDSFYGASYPASLWADIMEVALEGKENTPLEILEKTNPVPSPTQTQPTETPTTEPATASPAPSQPANEPSQPADNRDSGNTKPQPSSEPAKPEPTKPSSKPSSKPSEPGKTPQPAKPSESAKPKPGNP